MERIDDLQFQGLTIIQDSELPCFTQDAVLLTQFLSLRPDDRVIDLGCGNGLIPILGNGHYQADFTGIDCQEKLVDLARRSALGNGQCIDFRVMDVAEAPKVFGVGSFSAAVSNPPYYLAAGDEIHTARGRSRHGTLDELNQFCKAAFQLLKNRGSFYLCYPVQGLATILSTLVVNRLEPKRIQFVRTKPESLPYLALINAVKLGKPGLQIFQDRVLSDE